MKIHTVVGDPEGARGGVPGAEKGTLVPPPGKNYSSQIKGERLRGRERTTGK